MKTGEPNTNRVSSVLIGSANSSTVLIGSANTPRVLIGSANTPRVLIGSRVLEFQVEDLSGIFGGL